MRFVSGRIVSNVHVCTRRRRVADQRKRDLLILKSSKQVQKPKKKSFFQNLNSSKNSRIIPHPKIHCSLNWSTRMETSTANGLPENAYKELKEGEIYTPIMKADQSPPEITGWSVGWGMVMAVLFSAAAAYSGLKIGQVFEAAIPIAILAVGLSTIAKKKNA